MSTENKRFSTREWWLLIGLIVVLEYLFIDFVYANYHNVGLHINFSFAATIVSIILAVLAII